MEDFGGSFAVVDFRHQPEEQLLAGLATTDVRRATPFSLGALGGPAQSLLVLRGSKLATLVSGEQRVELIWICASKDRREGGALAKLPRGPRRAGERLADDCPPPTDPTPKARRS